MAEPMLLTCLLTMNNRLELVVTNRLLSAVVLVWEQTQLYPIHLGFQPQWMIFKRYNSGAIKLVVI